MQWKVIVSVHSLESTYYISSGNTYLTSTYFLRTLNFIFHFLNDVRMKINFLDED